MMNDQPQQQPQPRKRRTGTRLKDHKEPQEVDFNEFGLHVGDKQSTFASECGVLTRSHISISYTSWKKVPQKDKNLLWSTIKNRWDIQDENRKTNVLLTCNHQWRSFKKRLRGLILKNERNPFEVYEFLEKDDLQAFEEYIATEEFQVKSEKARASSKHNTNPARVGAKGYRGKKPKWEQEMASGELAPRLYEIRSERSRDYIMGRRSKENVVPPNIEPIVDKLIDVQSQISKGEVVPGPGEDLLTMVIGPEHPGRTRAVGQDVGLRKGMRGTDLKKRKRKESDDDILETLKDMKSKLAELQAKVDMHESRNEVTNDVRLRAQRDSCGSIRASDALDAIKIPTRCDLVLPYGDMNQKCAEGMVFPYGNGLVHSVPLRENHLKVMIDDIYNDYGNFPVPVKTGEVQNLQRAVGTTIQWPRNAIVLTHGQQREQLISTTSSQPTTSRGDINTIMTSQTTSTLLPTTITGGTNKDMPSQLTTTARAGTNKSIPSQTTSTLLPTTTTSGTNKNMPSQLTTTARSGTNKSNHSQTTSKAMPLLKPIEYLHDCLKIKPVVHVVSEPGILEAGTYDFSVTREEFLRLLRKQTADVSTSIMTTWQMILHSMVQTRMNTCAFLNPYKILGEACQINSEGVVSYLVNSMRLHHGKLFLLAPYLQNKHWVLLVICLRDRIVYILDSLRKPLQKPVDNHYLLKKHVDMAFARYVKDTSTPIEWMFCECNQQKFGGVESGHYVMRWIHEFVMGKQYGFLSQPDSIWNKTPFEEKILLKSIAMWAREFQNNYMNDVIV